MSLVPLFRQHLATRQKTTELALRECRFDALVIGAGAPQYYPEDDQTVPYRPFHHFAHWCPLMGDNHLLLIRPGQKPLLLAHLPADYWHETQTLGEATWLSEFDIRVCSSVDEVWQHLGSTPFTAYLGPDKTRAQASGLKTEVPNLAFRLNWERSYKSDYEIKCLERATKRAATGHNAAREAFLAGGSELDIHLAYMRAIRGTEASLPYESIVCLNEKCAVLHYNRKRDKTRMGKTFLIDAGCRYKGYGSDITRSYAADEAPSEFRDLLGAMSKLQQRLCGLIKPGLSFEHLHHQAHLEIAGLLIEHGILNGLSREAVVEERLSDCFFPHGLGHMLGILTHDVAGKQPTRTGAPAATPSKYRHLRSCRILDAGNVLTVEPGLYFIPLLLEPQRQGSQAAVFNWPLIDRLLPCGGIRIEDNLLVTHSGWRNITRQFLP